ncbi:MAG: ferredoxin--NADP reductase [Pseudomonadota bacterium]
MRNLRFETVLDVHHWNEGLFSIKTTRDPGLRFDSGQFIMLGVEVDKKPLMRAYSIASASWEEELEFYSIKVEDGPLTSRLATIEPGDEVLLSQKPTGTLLISDLTPGKRLYLLATGTGLAPFLSIIRDPETYERFDQVIVAHGVRRIADLAYRQLITEDLPNHPILGETIKGRLLYYPAVTRESFTHSGRLTTLINAGQLTDDLGLPALDPTHDRFMLCGSMAMIEDFKTLLDGKGFAASPSIGQAGDYVFERAFVG